MTITINTRTVFRFPTKLIVNRFTVVAIRRKLKKEGIWLTRKQTLLLIKEIRRYKKSHAGWNLVEIDEKNGDSIKVQI